MSARDDYPAKAIVHNQIVSFKQLPATRYDAAMDELDRLRAENQLLRNLLGNAEGAVIDAGFPGDTKPHDAIYALISERDALAADIFSLRAAVARLKVADEAWWARPLNQGSGVEKEANDALSALFMLVPSDGTYATSSYHQNTTRP